MMRAVRLTLFTASDFGVIRVTTENLLPLFDVGAVSKANAVLGD